MKDELIFSPFYRSFIALCKRNGISPTKAAKDAGISSGAPTAWKTKGAIPRPDQREKLCALFNVTESELLGYGDGKENLPAQGGETSEKDKRLIQWFRSLPPEKQKAILISQDAPEDLID